MKIASTSLGVNVFEFLNSLKAKIFLLIGTFLQKRVYTTKRIKASDEMLTFVGKIAEIIFLHRLLKLNGIFLI